MSWREVFLDYANRPKEELEESAIFNADVIYLSLRTRGFNRRADELFIITYSIFAVRDYNNVTDEEYELFLKITKPVLEMSYSIEDFQYYSSKVYDPSYYEDDLKEFIRDNIDIKEAVIKLGLCVSSLDDSTIDVFEQRVILHIDSI